MRFFLFLLVAFLCASPLTAIPRIAYSGASLVLPGSGELLLGSNTRGATLLGVDILSIYAFVATNNEIAQQRENYMKYAEVFAGVPYGMPRDHYQAVQDYISSDYYNDIQEMMARNYYLIYNYNPEEFADYLVRNTYTGIEAWKWDNEEHYNEYKTMRIRHQRTKMSHNFALGAMLLNRCISAIDSAILARDTKQTRAVYFSPSGK